MRARAVLRNQPPGMGGTRMRSSRRLPRTCNHKRRKIWSGNQGREENYEEKEERAKQISGGLSEAEGELLEGAQRRQERQGKSRQRREEGNTNDRTENTATMTGNKAANQHEKKQHGGPKECHPRTCADDN